jgi:hypothetical protein
VTFRSTDYPPGGGLFIVVLKVAPKPVPNAPLVEALVLVYSFDDAARIPSCLSTLPQS